MTTLTSLLLPGAADDPPLELGPPPGATARCQYCTERLTADQLGWRHTHPGGLGWLCRNGQNLARPDPHAITPPSVVNLGLTWPFRRVMSWPRSPGRNAMSEERSER